MYKKRSPNYKPPQAFHIDIKRRTTVIKRTSIVLALLFTFSFGQFVFALNGNNSTTAPSTTLAQDNRNRREERREDRRQDMRQDRREDRRDDNQDGWRRRRRRRHRREQRRDRRQDRREERRENRNDNRQ